MTYPANTDDHELPDVEAAPLPDDTKLAKVRDLAVAQLDLRRRIKRGEDLLADLKGKLKENLEVLLPAIMRQLGITTLGVAGQGGEATLTLRTATGASLPVKDAERYAAGLAWLDEHHPDLVKREITISFGREDTAWANKFMADCAKRKRPLNMVMRRWVEPQTLSAFVREQAKLAAAEGVDPETLAPSDKLGVYRIDYAPVETGSEEVAKVKAPGGAGR